MNFYNMKCFLELTKQMNFRRAADQLYISEQALSGMVSRMEKECGTPLLDRSSRFRLTPAGEVFAQKSREILTLNSEMMDEMMDIASEESGILRIGITRARANILLPRIVPLFLADHPKVSLIFTTAGSATLHEMLLKDELNLAISTSSAPPPGIVQERLMSERICAVIPKEIYHRHYPQLSVQADAAGLPMDFSEFRQERFLLPPSGLLYELAVSIFRRCNISPRYPLYMSDTELLVQLAAQNTGIALAFEHYAQDVLRKMGTGEVYLFPSGESDECVDVMVSFRKARYMDRLTRSFIELTRKSAALLS